MAASVGTIVQDPYQFGYQSIKVLAALVKGKDDVLKGWPGIEKGNSIFVPHRVITKDNVDEFKAEVKKILNEKPATIDAPASPRSRSSPITPINSGPSPSAARKRRPRSSACRWCSRSHPTAPRRCSARSFKT